VRKGERLAVENRAGSANLAEAAAFMDDQKRILIFSDAGGTGRSYHADLGAKNHRLRIHYLLEPGWKADAAIQGLGRTNRTNQA
ncbi:strawberry notch C-terminal domain-containing protein, partial [Acinetobacter baumannii]